MTSDPLMLLAVAGVFLLAGLVKGVIGLGLPSIAIGLLGLFLPPAEAATLLVLPSLLTNLWQAAWGGALPLLLRRLAPLLLGILAGAAAAALAGLGLGAGGVQAARQALGLALLLYGLLGLSERRLTLPPRAAGWAGGACGAATGLLTAATGVFVLPAVPYLQALGLERQALLQGMGLSFSASTLALALTLSGHAALGAAQLGTSALALAPTLLGMALGQRLRLPPLLFRRVFFLSLLLLGAHLALAARG
ncbi:sulfite exporter TauE/SafE family protein [Roseomonas sp. M0104]|uniref:Probable membrane transporter protein n=1 Tax=Teichococcus coralli TaxID=2545983 RepID=A0A845BCH2_9PROT|nr:TSUP family transporter [Pseudoroseomonas coralli]MXP63012.1 sulfite exporter TauE/SafE family protein [Pseudoroseomonas coralli]